MTDSLRRSAEQLAKDVGEESRRLYGLVRRVVVDRTRKGIWKILGYEDVPGAFVAESFSADLYHNVGFHSRPASGARVEAIVVGQPGARVIVATRDEGLRAKMAELAEDETAIFASQAIVHIKADGTVEIRAPGGTPLALAPKAEFDRLHAALVTAIAVLTLATDPAVTALEAVRDALDALLPAWPAGTTVLKAQ